MISENSHVAHVIVATALGCLTYQILHSARVAKNGLKVVLKTAPFVPLFR
jgi:hypothetical protein